MEAILAIGIFVAVVYSALRKSAKEKEQARQQGLPFYYDSVRKEIRSSHERDPHPAVQTTLGLAVLPVVFIIIALLIGLLAFAFGL